jgi:hypothetical protein
VVEEAGGGQVMDLGCKCQLRRKAAEGIRVVIRAGLDFYVTVVGRRYRDRVPRVSAKLVRRPARELGQWKCSV